MRDTGEGIEPLDLERVFERFHWIDPARARSSGGSGIGLTVARAIVAAQGGSMRAESGGRGEGARFIVTLPLAAHPARRGQFASGPRESRSG